MITYAIILFCASVLFFGLSIAIYRGRVDLIHDYHQTRVTDRAAYGKAFAKALASIGVAMAISGGVSLSDETDAVALAAVAVLIAGLIGGVLAIVVVQKKYNGGVF